MILMLSRVVLFLKQVEHEYIWRNSVSLLKLARFCCYNFLFSLVLDSSFSLEPK